MRLLIDANIILDVLEKREPHYEQSALVWKLCETEQDEGFVSSLTFANLVYVMRQRDAKYISKNGDLKCDAVFDSPSGASKFVLYSSSSGNVDWKDENGTSLGEAGR